MKISAVINTRNEENNIADCLDSLASVDEIVVVDMESDDKTKDIAFKFTKHVYNHKKVGYVEPARNFAISKTTGDWIFILDADERVPRSLAVKLIEIAEEKQANFVRIPRKNIIFNKWIKHSRWWPDYNVRFFKRGKVEWQNAIHSIPITVGEGITLEDKEDYAIEHYHYNTISEFLDKVLRYTNIQSKELLDQGYKLEWQDLINKPLSEFLSRFFASQGYRDGLHGLALAGLQAFSEFLVYLKVWEAQGFTPKSGKNFELNLLSLFKQKRKEFNFWTTSLKIENADKKTIKLLLRLKRKFS